MSLLSISEEELNLFSNRVTAGIGSSICLGGIAFKRTSRACSSILEAFDPSPADGKTIPGESSSLSLLSILTSRNEVVTPASAPTGHAAPAPPRRDVRALMTEDFPTFG